MHETEEISNEIQTTQLQSPSVTYMCSCDVFHLHWLVISPLGRTEGDDKFLGRTADQRWGTVIGITVIGGTCIFEHLWVQGWLALVWGAISIPATEHVQIERQTCALACHHCPTSVQHPKLQRASAVDVLCAPSDRTARCTWRCSDWDREVVSINYTDVIETQLALIRL